MYWNEYLYAYHKKHGGQFLAGEEDDGLLLLTWKDRPLVVDLLRESGRGGCFYQVQARLPATLDTGKNMNILIGPENVNDALKDTSVVMASYDIGDNMRGVIGVVGPTRMDYAKVTARLSYFADSLTRMFGKELPSPEDSEV